MSLSRGQQLLYFREWAAVKRVLMPGRETFTKLEENERRHAITIEALGADKSSTDFTNDDFDKVLAAFRAISQPGNLQAQLDALDGRKKRLRFGIMSTARKLVGAEDADAYVRGVVSQMHARAGEPRDKKRKGSPLKNARFDQLDEADLEKVRIALSRQEARGMTIAEPGPITTKTITVGTELARNYEDREVAAIDGEPF